MIEVKVAVIATKYWCRGGKVEYKAVTHGFRNMKGTNIVSVLVDTEKRGWKRLAKKEAIKKLKYGDIPVHYVDIGD